MLVPLYTAPIILTDSIFTSYGGQTGTTTAAQRQAAYLIAETQMSNHFGTFLLPTIVTGTFDYRPVEYLTTDYGMVHRILRADVVDKNNNILYMITGSGYRYIYIDQDSFAYLHVSDFPTYCNPYFYNDIMNPLAPKKYRVAYEAGLPTGTANHPAILLGLTMAAQITLNEMIFPSANESSGDIGVESFSSLDYSEKRKPLKNTAFGNSARANKIAQLVDGAGIKKYKRALIL